MSSWAKSDAHGSAPLWALARVKKATTLVGSKKSPVDLKPEVEYKN